MNKASWVWTSIGLGTLVSIGGIWVASVETGFAACYDKLNCSEQTQIVVCSGCRGNRINWVGREYLKMNEDGTPGDHITNACAYMHVSCDEYEGYALPSMQTGEQILMYEGTGSPNCTPAVVKNGDNVDGSIANLPATGVAFNRALCSHP